MYKIHQYHIVIPLTLNSAYANVITSFCTYKHKAPKQKIH